MPLHRLYLWFRASRLVGLLARGTVRENVDTVDRLLAIGEPAVRPLMRALTSEDWTTRVEAIRALGILGAEAALERLVQISQGDDPQLAGAAKEAIRRILARREGRTRH